MTTIRIGDWVEVYDRGRLQERGPVTHLMPVPDERVMVFVERRLMAPEWDCAYTAFEGECRKIPTP